jgi:hypothetical protein
MPRKLRTSFVGHPSAILFLLISRVGLFQHPQDLTPVTLWSLGKMPSKPLLVWIKKPGRPAGALSLSTHR